MSQPGLPTGVGLTAISVARERSEESKRPDRLFQDEWAGAFCDAAREAMGPRTFPGFDVTLSDFVPMLRGYMALRTRYFDDACLAACAQGCQQAVILAAGLDARAFRLPWPQGMRLFELDRAEMLAFKRRVLEERGAVATCERHEVAVDLRTDWAPALLAAGFARERPTVWLVEGLLIYLSDRDNDRLLGTLSALSAPGSQLLLEHADTRVLKQPGMAARGAEALEAQGITWQSGIDDPVAWLQGHGWSARELEAAAYARSLGRPLPPALDASSGQGRLWLASGRR